MVVDILTKRKSKGIKLLGLSCSELEQLLTNYGYPSYRGKQIYKWLYHKGIKDLTEISDLPKSIREEFIKEGFSIGRLKLTSLAKSNDETLKLLLSTADDDYIETVGIPTEKRLTACLSSQIGCSMDCKFCATGKAGLKRSLYSNEIIDQILSLQDVMKRNVSHVVFMGMGEPLLNMEQLLISIRCINEDLGISQRRITVSTVGIPGLIQKLLLNSLEKLGKAQFTLAVSLHASNQTLREKIIPSAKNYPIKDLIKDCKEYVLISKRRISFEYLLIDDINDQKSHAYELAELISGFQSHVNLIQYNPIEEADFKRPTNNKVRLFSQYLLSKGIEVSIRRSRGLERNSACGQLRSYSLSK